ncbi:MAG: S8 family serine peptidase [Gaiella sp.]
MRRTTAQRADSGVRANALWGRPGRRFQLLLVTTLVLSLAVVAGFAHSADAVKPQAYLSSGLLDEATNNPDKLFDVIVQAARGKKSEDAASEVTLAQQADPSVKSKLKRKFFSIAGTSATLTGRQIVKLAKKSRIESITRDTKIKLEGSFTSNQVWTQAANVQSGWSSVPDSANFPTIAVVDSGVTGLPTFDSRFQGNIYMMSSSTTPGAYGHGTFVSSIAAGGEAGYAGAEPRAKILSIKVLDGGGAGSKSDVIAAADWILQNRVAYNIRVANFSLNTGGDSILYDALDRAVEALWLNGVVVVAAAGNYAVNGQRSDVGFAPANDPFVITVGASDTKGTATRSDDGAAPWSAWGYTQDGFFKPEISAPGRYLVGAVPTGANLLTLFPTRQVAPNYLWMSGTSFAAPVISGLAATILAKNPTWTPDQVKGAIMQSATVPSGYGSNGALGVGVVNAAAALAASGTANPNAGLNAFVSYDSTLGRKTFNPSAWKSYAASNASWASASWSSASWSSASWSSASWSSASWSSASWSSASWASASWASASWANGYTME